MSEGIDGPAGPRIVAVHAAAGHAFSKGPRSGIELIAGEGVRGDAHCGVTVRHRSRVARDPTQPNLRQVHLIHEELFAELAGRGLTVRAGDLGENITTTGLAVLGLSEGAVLRLGARARVRVTGLRNPCAQIESFMPGLLAAVLGRDAEGRLVRKAGIMGVVIESGRVGPGDAIVLEHAPLPHRALQPV